MRRSLRNDRVSSSSERAARHQKDDVGSINVKCKLPRKGDHCSAKGARAERDYCHVRKREARVRLQNNTVRVEQKRNDLAGDVPLILSDRKKVMRIKL